MDFTILDPNVSLTTNIFVIIANVINLLYNIPQMYKTWQTRSTKDFSTTFLVMRILGNAIWIVYAIEISSFLMLLNNCVTVMASIFLFYFTALNIYAERMKLKNEFTQYDFEKNELEKLDDNI